MKTSNKLLLGALALVIALMIVANFYFKAKVEEFKKQRTDTEQLPQDSLRNDTVNKIIQIRID